MKLLQSIEVVEALIKESQELVNQNVHSNKDLEDACRLNLGLLWVSTKLLQTKLDKLNKEG